MKTLSSIGFALTLLVGFNSNAQNPDQNPNYKVSQSKYVEKSTDLNATQGETIQDTYEAFDWTEYKAEKKQDRKDRRYDRRTMRYRSHHTHYNSSNGYYNNSGYNNNGYNNNGYNNNGYNNSNYNNGYNNNGYNGGGNNCGSGSLYNSILLGATLYSIFN